MSQKTNIQFDDQEKADRIISLFNELSSRDQARVRGELLNSGGKIPPGDMEIKM